MSLITKETLLTQQNRETLIFNMFTDAYPSLDCGPGTPLYEMVIRPMAMLWTKQQEGASDLYSATSFENVTNMDTTAMDRLMTKFFLTRRTGSYVTGTVRVYFNTKQDIYLTAGDIWEASNDRYYQVVSDSYTAAGNLPGNDTDGYYVDVAVISVGKGSSYNASANDSVTVTGAMSAYVRRAFFLADSSEGGTIETNTNFYNRGKDELASRGLYSYKNVKAILRDNFDLSQVIPVGIKDAEMIRDLTVVRGVGTIHRGGMADIYVQSPTLTTVTGYQPPLGFPYAFNSKSIVDSPEDLIAAWNSAAITTSDISTRGSMQEVIPLLTVSSPMTTLHSNISSIDTFVGNDDNTLLHTDNLVKEMWPLVVKISVTISTTQDTDSVKSLVKTYLVNYVTGLSSNSAPRVDDVIHAVKQAGVEKVNVPISMSCYYITEDLRMESIGLNKVRTPSASLLIPQENDSLKFIIEERSQISLRTCCWYTNADLIDVEVV